jgi:hypothetical protein
MIQQIKHETGHVQFRVLRESAIGQNSLQLSGSTPAHSSVLLKRCHVNCSAPRPATVLTVMEKGNSTASRFVT